MEPMKFRVKRCVKPRSYFFVPLTTRAAAFTTRRNLSVTDFGAPATMTDNYYDYYYYRYYWTLKNSRWV